MVNPYSITPKRFEYVSAVNQPIIVKLKDLFSTFVQFAQKQAWISQKLCENYRPCTKSNYVVHLV